MNQTQRIRAHLEAGLPLTPLSALELFGCLRLGARIWELREQGLPVQTIPTTLPSGKVVATYTLLKKGTGA